MFGPTSRKVSRRTEFQLLFGEESVHVRFFHATNVEAEHTISHTFKINNYFSRSESFIHLPRVGNIFINQMKTITSASSNLKSTIVI